MHAWYNAYDPWTTFSIAIGIFVLWSAMVAVFGAWKVFIDDKSNDITEEPAAQ